MSDLYNRFEDEECRIACLFMRNKSFLLSSLDCYVFSSYLLAFKFFMEKYFIRFFAKNKRLSSLTKANLRFK